MSEQEQTVDTNIQTEQQEQPTQPLSDAPESSTGDFMSDSRVMAYIDSKIQEGIQKALQGNAPRVNTANPTAAEQERFNKMTYKERLNLFNSNPQAYNKLSKGCI